MKDRTKRARELLGTIQHIALATTDSDGAPHNTPLFVASDSKLNVYWSSSPESEHSRNIKANGHGYIVWFDSISKGGGLYMRARAQELNELSEIEVALAVFNKARMDMGKTELGVELFMGESPQRLYRAEPIQLWINMSGRDARGNITRDVRHEVTALDVMGR